MNEQIQNTMQDILKINRAKWRTGDGGEYETGNGYTQLLNGEGYMCCLGFRCNQLGIPKSTLIDAGMPSDVDWEIIPDLVRIEHRVIINTNFSNTAQRINDDVFLTPDKREEKIKKHFAKKNIKVVFTGKYKKKN